MWLHRSHVIANLKRRRKWLIVRCTISSPADLELVKELSKPGAMYVYHVDIGSTQQGDNGIITDIALQDPTNKER